MRSAMDSGEFDVKKSRLVSREPQQLRCRQPPELRTYRHYHPPRYTGFLRRYRKLV